VEAVAAYIGIVKAGCAVVSIADSFSSEEIATRLRISGARAVFTQDVILRGAKTIPMYQRVADARAARAIVIPASGRVQIALGDTDLEWGAFLTGDDTFDSVICDASDTVNILFSSGTTGEPKAIPWTQTTPIKCAMDGLLHQNIKPGDVVAWPTNIGWMMGPWFIFASLLNRATMALYYGVPNTREFCEFVQNAKVQMLGVVPSLVKVWRAVEAVDGLDWSAIRVFSSTGEASNAQDYLYLMSLADYRPVIEYCGGTEIGGGYVSGTVVQPASPSTFSTPALGLGMYLLDENGMETTNGEVFLVPPSIGLSTSLLNRDHHEIYFAGTPTGPKGEVLRRHGDQMERLDGGYYRCQGRADDTMNLGGIKVSSAEIERAVSGVEGLVETVAIAFDPPGGGPSLLVLYAVREANASVDAPALRMAMHEAISRHLNPLFKIHDVVLIDSLPRTASNKVMRRVLRERYAKKASP
jgi:acetyl-CoA synthetase